MKDKEKSKDELIVELEEMRLRVSELEEFTKKQGQTEEQIRESEGKYRNLIEATRTGYQIVDETGRVIDANDEYLRLTGRKNLEDILGKSVLEWTAEYDRERNKKEIAKCYQKGFVKRLEIDYVDEKGIITPIEVNASVTNRKGEKQILALCRDITERVQTEKKLRASEELFQLVVSNITTAVWKADVTEDGTLEYKYTSPVYNELLGLPVTTATDEWDKHLSYIKPECREKIDNALKEAIEIPGKTVNFDFEVVKANGEEAWFNSRGRCFEKDGKLIVFGSTIDITEQKKTERKIKRSKESERILLDSIQTQVWYLLDEYTFGAINQAKADFLGIDIRKLAHSDMRKHFSEEAINTTVKNNALIFKTGKTFKTESWVPNALGEKRLLSIIKTPKKDAEGKVEYVICSAEDITERRLAEKGMKEAHTILNRSTGIAFTWKNEEGWPVEFVTENVETLFGYTAKEFMSGKISHLNCIHKDDIKRVKEEVAVFSDKKDCTRFFHKPYRILTKEGVEKIISDKTFITRDTDGNVTHYSGIVEDISEQAKIEAQLKLQSHALDAAANAIVITDFDGKTQWVNQAFTTLTGYSFTEALGENPRVLKSGKQDNAFYQNMWETILKGNVWQDKLINKRKNSSLYYEEMTISPLLSEKGKVTNFVAIKQDISEKVEKEKKLEEQEEQFRQLFNNMSSAVAIYEAVDNGEDFIFKNFNKAGEKIERIKKEKLIGKSVLEVFPGIKEFGLFAVFQRVWKTGISEYHPLSIYQDHRIVGWRENYVYKLPNGEIVATYNDVTERKQAGADVAQQLSELETLYESGLAISGLLDEKEIANRIIKVLEEKLEWHHVVIRAYDEANNTLKILGLNLIDINKIDIQKHITHLNNMVSTPDEGLSGWVVKHKKSLRVNNLSKDKRYIVSYNNMNAGIYAPMMVGNKVTGIITIESRKPDAFSAKDERLLNTLANQAAISLENAKLYIDIQNQLKKRKEAEEDLRQLNLELEERITLRTAEIEKHKRRMELATSTAGIGIWERKQNQETQFWDARMHAIYGTSPEEFEPTYTNWLSFVHPDDKEKVQTELKKAMSESKPYDVEYRIIRSDKSLRYISSQAIIIINEEGEYTEFIGINTDITNRKKVEETLRQANIELGRALKIKDEFLANMSHELRTPLNAIMGLSESLIEKTAGPINKKQNKYLKIINESGHHLLSLINDILDLAKIESGEVLLHIEKVNINKICEASIRMLKQQSQKKNQKIIYEIDKNINKIWADERRLKQIIVNLLSNAVKFTPQGGNLGIKVSAEYKKNLILIKIWDEGIGIDKKDQAQIFTPFVQIDSGLARKEVGTGLGLTLVKQLVTLHNGYIKIESTPMQGSTFTIYLPSKLAKDTDKLPSLPEDNKEEKKQVTDTGKTILLVEDTVALTMMLKDYLEKNKYQVFCAKNGIEGIAKSKKHQPNLILMDVMMPLMDGFEATKKIKSEPELKKIPIIGMTALAMSEDRQKCLEAGMDDYMSKPVILGELLSMIKKHL